MIIIIEIVQRAPIRSRTEEHLTCLNVCDPPELYANIQTSAVLTDLE